MKTCSCSKDSSASYIAVLAFCQPELHPHAPLPALLAESVLIVQRNTQILGGGTNKLVYNSVHIIAHTRVTPRPHMQVINCTQPYTLV